MLRRLPLDVCRIKQASDDRGKMLPGVLIKQLCHRVLCLFGNLVKLGLCDSSQIDHSCLRLSRQYTLEDLPVKTESIFFSSSMLWPCLLEIQVLEKPQLHSLLCKFGKERDQVEVRKLTAEHHLIVNQSLTIVALKTLRVRALGQRQNQRDHGYSIQ
jgi:hypothetical protein